MPPVFLLTKISELSPLAVESERAFLCASYCALSLPFGKSKTCKNVSSDTVAVCQNECVTAQSKTSCCSAESEITVFSSACEEEKEFRLVCWLFIGLDAPFASGSERRAAGSVTDAAGLLRM